MPTTIYRSIHHAARSAQAFTTHAFDSLDRGMSQDFLIVLMELRAALDALPASPVAFLGPARQQLPAEAIDEAMGYMLHMRPGELQAA